GWSVTRQARKTHVPDRNRWSCEKRAASDRVGLQQRTTLATDCRSSGRKLHQKATETDRALRFTRSAGVHALRFSVSPLERPAASADSKNSRTDRRSLSAV